MKRRAKAVRKVRTPALGFKYARRALSEFLLFTLIREEASRRKLETKITACRHKPGPSAAFLSKHVLHAVTLRAR